MKKTSFLVFILLFNLHLFSQDKSKVEFDSIFTRIEQKFNSKDFEKAQNLLNQVNLVSKNEKQQLITDFWQSKIFIENGNDEKALKTLLHGFTKLKIHNPTNLYTLYAKEIGKIFGRAKNYDKALNYFNLALQNSFVSKDSINISSSYFNLGSTYQMKNNLDSASYFYANVIKFHPKKIKEKEIVATTYINLMSLAVRDNKFKDANEYGEEALQIYTVKNDTIKIAGTLNNLGGISMYKNDLEKSNEYSFRAIELLKNKNSLKAKEIKFYALDNISQVYYLQGNYKEAYTYLYDSAEIRSQILNDNLKSKVTEIEAKYNLAKEGERTKIEENKRQRAEFWLYILVFASTMLLVVLWILYRNFKFKRRNLELEHAQDAMTAQQKIGQIKNETQAEILNATIDAKEVERKHIAEILHDSVSTLLSSANLHLYAVKSKFKNQEVPEEIIKTEKIISEAADKIRNLSHKLISPVLLKFGLKFSIEDLCEKYANSQLEFDCDCKNINRYQQNFEIKIHNIIDELINNILKHSKATKVLVTAEESEGFFKISIQDNGVGFVVSEIHKKLSLGLSQIETRIKVMNGEFTIDSSKEKGTHIFMRIPISDKK